MRKIPMMLMVVVLMACGGPDLPNIDLLTTSFQEGDLPAAITAGAPYELKQPDLPPWDTNISRLLERGEEVVGTTDIFLYADAEQLNQAYQKLSLARGKPVPGLGERSISVVSLFQGRGHIIFTRCHALASLTLKVDPAQADALASYASKLDQRLAQVACWE